MGVQEHIVDRVLRTAEYILETGATVRACAKRLGVSKTTVHKDMRVRLPQVDPATALAVSCVLEKNKAERHLRGGEATRRKYLVDDSAKC